MLEPDDLSVILGKNDVEIVAREALYHGFFSLDLYRFRHRLFNGQMSHEVWWEIFERGHVIVLLPFGPMCDEVVLVEQTRAVTYNISETPWLLEMAAGMIEEGESVESVARHGVIGEAGLIVKRIKPMSSFLAGPGSTDGRSSIMVGEAGAATVSGICGLVDENEGIHAHVVNREQAYQ